jgi:hypothetical protein
MPIPQGHAACRRNEVNRGNNEQIPMTKISNLRRNILIWIPASAGMTNWGAEIAPAYQSFVRRAGRFE